MNATTVSSSLASHLICSTCNTVSPIHEVQTYAHCCAKPLTVIYDFTKELSKASLLSQPNTMWRYAAILPVLDPRNIVSLGEGMTPILPLNNLAATHNFKSLLIKDEGLNPTGSFKSRGLSMAISKAKELGIEHCVIPTAGNAGGAMSAYCAAAGIKATVVMPSHTPQSFKQECELYGAELHLVDGLINKCGVMAAEIQEKEGAFNISTLKEPYRLEGKKTMGYEIAEHLNWELPDVILYPTGGGTGLIGIWKAFHEMISLGWLKANVKLPRMIVVQADNCSPVVDFLNGEEKALVDYGESIANGLAVPVAFGRDMIAKVVRESGGTTVTVTDKEMIDGVKEVAKSEGLLMAPESAALWKGLLKLVDRGEVSRGEKILMINTGNGYKYLEHLV